MRLQDRAEAAIIKIHRYQEQLESQWTMGNLKAIQANIRLIEKATNEIKEVIKQQLYDNLAE